MEMAEAPLASLFRMNRLAVAIGLGPRLVTRTVKKRKSLGATV